MRLVSGRQMTGLRQTQTPLASTFQPSFAKLLLMFSTEVS